MPAGRPKKSGDALTFAIRSLAEVEAQGAFFDDTKAVISLATESLDALAIDFGGDVAIIVATARKDYRA